MPLPPVADWVVAVCTEVGGAEHIVRQIINVFAGVHDNPTTSIKNVLIHGPSGTGMVPPHKR